MTGAASTNDVHSVRLTATGLRRMVSEHPLIPLIGLLVVLVIAIEIAQPGIVGPGWAGVILRTAVPLAILAGCQTLTMLTGGIDLSVGAVASMSGFVLATLVNGPGTPAGIVIALAAAALCGLVTGIGVGVFRVHPLIMTLAMSLVVLGLANVWQLQMVQTGSGVPEGLRWLGSGTFLDVVPNSILVFVPVAALILFVLRRTGYGRLLYAIGDNPIASRLAGARAWQVLIVEQRAQSFARVLVHTIDVVNLHLIEEQLFLRLRMLDSALGAVDDTQPAIRLPLEIAPGVAAHLLDRRLVRRVEE